MEYRINKLENDIVEVNDNIDDLHQKLDKIMMILKNDIGKKCDRMEDHITFVESIYETIKNPLGFVCEKINTVIASGKDYSTYLLPNINNEEEFELE